MKPTQTKKDTADMATTETLARVIQFFPESIHRQAARLATVAAELNRARLALASAKAKHDDTVRTGTTPDVTTAWKALADAQNTLDALTHQVDVLRQALAADMSEVLKGTAPAPVKAASGMDRKAGAARTMEAATHLRRAFEALGDAVDVYQADTGEPTGASLLHEETALLTTNLPADTARALRQRVVPSYIPGSIPPVIYDLLRQATNALEIYDPQHVKEWRERGERAKAAKAT